MDPQLAAALAFHGGPTRTHALLAGSPAIDAVAPGGCVDGLGAALPTDQRGYVRYVDGDADDDPCCDIGAYEYGSVFVRQNQTITFNALLDKTLGDSPFTLSATALSGLSVSFSSSTPAVCTVSGNVVTLVSAGNCTVVAARAGNASYNPAPNVSRSFTVHNPGQAPGSYLVFLPLIVR